MKFVHTKVIFHTDLTWYPARTCVELLSVDGNWSMVKFPNGEKMRVQTRNIF